MDEREEWLESLDIVDPDDIPEPDPDPPITKLHEGTIEGFEGCTPLVVPMVVPSPFCFESFRSCSGGEDRLLDKVEWELLLAIAAAVGGGGGHSCCCADCVVPCNCVGLGGSQGDGDDFHLANDLATLRTRETRPFGLRSVERPKMDKQMKKQWTTSI